MTYQVSFVPLAEKDVEAAYLWYLQEAGAKVAHKWLAGFNKEIENLTQLPHRFATAYEDERSPLELRHLFYYSHRIIFTIQDEANVLILHVRHSSQAPVID